MWVHSEGGVGLPMKYWYHFVYNIVEGARKSVGAERSGHIRAGLARCPSSTTNVWNTLLQQGEKRRGDDEATGREGNEKETEIESLEDSIHAGYIYIYTHTENARAPLKNYLFLADLEPLPSRRSPRLD